MYIHTEELHYNTSVNAVENSNYLPVANTVNNKNIHFVLTISILVLFNYMQITIFRRTVFKNTLDSRSFFAQKTI